METVTVNAHPVAPATDLEADLRRVRVLARWMDSQFEVLGVRFGADALLGLLPIVGDTLSVAAALYPLHVARKHGLGKPLVTRMAANVAIDWVVGLVPGAGDIADLFYKANLKNLELLERAAEKRRQG